MPNILSQPGNAFIHVGNIANTETDTTYVDDPSLNSHQAARFLATMQLGAEGTSTSRDNHPVQLKYNLAANAWGINNADLASMPGNTTWNVFVPPQDDTLITHVAVPGNTSGNHTTIDNPLLNGDPDALILVTQNYGTGVTNQANNHWLGVWYDTTDERWLIFNQDALPMATGVMFNVLVIPPKSGFSLLTAGATNAYELRIDNPNLDGNPYARVYVMHNWNPPESPSDKFNDHPIGVDYDAAGDQHWYLYNRDFFPITTSATFNMYYTWPRGNSFTISADAFNTTTDHGMTVNSPLLNDISGAHAIVSYNKYPNGTFGGDYDSQVGLLFGVDLSWHIFNNGGPAFPLYLSYNVLAPPSSQSFVVVANTGPGGNASGNDLVIDNPLTNDDPWAFVFVTPRGAPGIDEHNLGVYYTGFAWGIFNEGGASFVGGQTFNVFVIKRHYLDLPLVRR